MNSNDKYYLYANKMNLIVSWILALIVEVGLIISIFMRRINPIAVIGILLYLNMMLITATYRYKKDNADKNIGRLAITSLYVPWILTMFASKELIMYTFAFPLIVISALYAQKKKTINLISITAMVEVIKILLNGTSNIKENFIPYIIMIAISMAFFITTYIVVTVIDRYMKVSHDSLNEVMEAKVKQEEYVERNAIIAKLVNDNSNKISNLVEEIKTSTETVTCAIEEIARGASTIAEDIQSQSESVEEINSMIEGAVKECNVMDEASNNTSLVINEGTEIVKKLTEESDIVTRNTEEVSNLMKELQDECNEIATITSVIVGIASQTKCIYRSI